jgi:hypothetical protein
MPSIILPLRHCQQSGVAKGRFLDRTFLMGKKPRGHSEAKRWMLGGNIIKDWILMKQARRRRSVKYCPRVSCDKWLVEWNIWLLSYKEIGVYAEETRINFNEVFEWSDNHMPRRRHVVLYVHTVKSWDSWVHRKAVWDDRYLRSTWYETGVGYWEWDKIREEENTLLKGQVQI